MVKYTIYTENKNRERVEDLLGSYLSAFTILAGKGVYRGQAEPCLVVTYIGGEDAAEIIDAVALKIKEENDQQEILVTRESIVAIDL